MSYRYCWYCRYSSETDSKKTRYFCSDNCAINYEEENKKEWLDKFDLLIDKLSNIAELLSSGATN